MTDIVLEILDFFLFGMSSDVPAFNVHVLCSDFEFQIGVNEY